MGGSTSKEESSASQPAANEEIESGGFHMIEVHARSVGMGSFAIILCLIFGVVSYLLYKRYCQNSAETGAGRIRRSAWAHDNFSPPPTYPAAPIQPPFPYQPFAPAFPSPCLPSGETGVTFYSPYHAAFNASAAAALSLPPYTPMPQVLAPARRQPLGQPRIEILDESPRPARRPASVSAAPRRSAAAAPAPSTSAASSSGLACDV